MKRFRSLLSLVLVASAIGSACAQQASSDQEPLIAVGQQLRAAMAWMGPCPPIYQGHCGQSKSAIQQARKIIASLLPPPTPAAAPATKAPTAEPAKVAAKVEAPKKAAANAPFTAPATTAKPLEKATPATPLTEEEKIAASQARMHKGLEHLQLAIDNLKKAASSVQNPDIAAQLQKLLQTALDEANKAVGIYDKKS